MQKISVWNGTYQNRLNFPQIQNNISIDVAIVGGGITGIATAYLLAKKGIKCIVLEALEVGGGTTAHSTGNLYCMVDEKLQKVKQKFDAETSKKVAQSRKAAVDEIEKIIAENNIECDFIRTQWVNYTFISLYNNILEKEFETATEAGIDCRLATELPELPYKIEKALIVENQAQFHPLKFVHGLAKVATQFGAQIFENSKVLKFDKEDDTYILHTKNASVTAKKVVMATHMPKGFDPIQTLLYPYREYGVAATLKSGNYPKGILWGIKDDLKKYSLRSYSNGGQNYLMCIGEPHKTGQNENNDESFANLENFLKSHFDVNEVVYRWGGQHYKSADSIPYIGKSGSNPDMYFATGMATDGLTYGVLAGMIISDEIAGKENEFAHLYEPRRFTPAASAGKFVKENVNMAAQYIKDIPTGFGKEAEDVLPGEAKVVFMEGGKYAVYREETGKLHVVSAICPHLLCVVHWNKSEKSWDCPCHGSRFTYEGRVIEGPAIHDLQKLENN